MRGGEWSGGEGGGHRLDLAIGPCHPQIIETSRQYDASWAESRSINIPRRSKEVFLPSHPHDRCINLLILSRWLYPRTIPSVKVDSQQRKPTKNIRSAPTFGSRRNIVSNPPVSNYNSYRQPYPMYQYPVLRPNRRSLLSGA
ncbi:unnamed protein product [Penicillium roqueforti FM164]|uniref:Genomic scaffold, ProqFM164S02 n=1 Tax=Penicillium roqueforti (strain FM164) TaxID=1365484 RepID=W6QFC3_PENRF|nr:unnamed protein product [Penicillium roqueforti FM164]